LRAYNSARPRAASTRGGSQHVGPSVRVGPRRSSLRAGYRSIGGHGLLSRGAIPRKERIDDLLQPYLRLLQAGYLPLELTNLPSRGVPLGS
jgi:hypothetical protein